MSQENLDFKGVKRLIQEKEESLRQIELDINALLVACENPKGGSLWHVSQQMDEKRYYRNKVRSEYLDLEYNLKLLKRRFFESRLIEQIARVNATLFFKIEDALRAHQGEDQIEKQIIFQQRAACYRKLENAFKDQASMVRQKHLAELSGKEDLEWEARLEHALAKSKRYFARQCGKIKYFRERLMAISTNEYSHHFYLMAVQHIGHEGITALMSDNIEKAA